MRQVNALSRTDTLTVSDFKEVLEERMIKVRDMVFQYIGSGDFFGWNVSWLDEKGKITFPTVTFQFGFIRMQHTIEPERESMEIYVVGQEDYVCSINEKAAITATAFEDGLSNEQIRMLLVRLSKEGMRRYALICQASTLSLLPSS